MCKKKLLLSKSICIWILGMGNRLCKCKIQGRICACGNEFRDLNPVIIVLVLVLHFVNISICIIFCGYSIQIYLIGPLNVTSSHKFAFDRSRNWVKFLTFSIIRGRLHEITQVLHHFSYAQWHVYLLLANGLVDRLRLRELWTEQGRKPHPPACLAHKYKYNRALFLIYFHLQLLSKLI